MRQSLYMLPLLGLLACGGGGGYGSSTPTNPNPTPTPTPTATTSVTMQSNTFNPSAILVSPGATVTFTNSDGINHNVTFNSGGGTNIPSFSTGSKTTVMTNTVGTYGYHCTIHAGMSGTIQVQ